MKLLLHVVNERKITHFSEKKSFTMAFQVNAQAENYSQSIPSVSISLKCKEKIVEIYETTFIHFQKSQ